MVSWQVWKCMGQILQQSHVIQYREGGIGQCSEQLWSTSVGNLRELRTVKRYVTLDLVDVGCALELEDAIMPCV